VTATAPESGPDAGGRCPHCGESVDAGASFCEACGKPLDAAGGVDGPSAPADAGREEGPMDDLGSGPISASVQLPRTVELPPPIAIGRVGRAASSVRRKPHREAPRLLASTSTVMAHHHGGRGADANQVVRRIIEYHAYRKALGDNYPFEPIVHGW